MRRKIDKEFFIKSVIGYKDAMQYKKIDLDHFLHDRKKDLAKEMGRLREAQLRILPKA